MSLSLKSIQDIGQTLEALAQGLYISAFYRCMIVLFRGKRRVPLYPLSGTLLLLFVVGTTYFIAGVYHVIREDTPGVVLEHTTATRFRDYSFIISTEIINAFMVYRCFVVWNRWRRIALFPSIICLASFGLGVWLAVLCAQKNLPLFQVPMVPKLFCIVGFVLHLTLSSLILYRIWNIQCEISKGVEKENRFIRRMASLVVESGFLFVGLFLALVVANFVSMATTSVICGCVVPLQGLVATSIILRVAKGISHGNTMTSIPIEFRHSTFSSQTKESSRLNTLLSSDDSEVEVGTRDRLRFDLNN